MLLGYKCISSCSFLTNLPVLLLCATIVATMAAEQQVQQVLKANNAFASKLYQAVVAEAKPNENVFMSPLSAHTILSLVHQGALEDTESEMRSVLNLNNKEDTAAGYESIQNTLNNVSGVTLTTANKIFVKPTIEVLPAFQQTATKSFLSETQSVDFSQSQAAAKIINDWVEGQTNNKIKDLISSDQLDELTAMVLVNAIYFKGLWDKKFEKSNTRKKDFYTSETDKQECDMMYQKSKFRYAESEELDAQILELPYEGKKMSMLIILPRTRTGIGALEQKLADFDLGTLTQNMRQEEVEVYLPRFKIEHKIDLKAVLQKMGMTTMFSDNANFKAITNKVDLKVSDAIQKAFIEVNEEGTEAAAATGVGIMLMSMPLAPRMKIIFNVDHPCIILISERSALKNVPLFMGKVLNLQAN